MVIVVDCGLGNIASVVNMIQKIGGKAKSSGNCDEIYAASKIVLPGVGAFDHGIEQLAAHNLLQPIKEKALDGTPLLAICLGMQLLGKRSEEGCLNGLGLIDAEFKRFSFEGTSSIRIPHVGWNHVQVVKENALLPNDRTEQRFYFTHSYHAVCKREEDVFAVTDYGYRFTSAFCHENIFGVQFHPEKSHRFGMALMKRFMDL